MSLFGSLFGKKVTIQLRDEAGNLVERKITEAQFKKLQASGAVGKNELVEVHVLDPQGNYTAHWEVGKDISAEIVQKAKHPSTGALYAVTTYEGGKPTTRVCKYEVWLTFKAQFDSIEQEGADAMAETRRKYPELFR